jgi:NAD(P)-dependent dehydrogenase (short-subunit alcohol dehydrogenase family)
MNPLEGKVAIITGTARLRGIGRATAVTLAEMGADIVVTGTGRDPATFPEDEKSSGWRGVESTAAQVQNLIRDSGLARPVFIICARGPHCTASEIDTTSFRIYSCRDPP